MPIPFRRAAAVGVVAGVVAGAVAVTLLASCDPPTPDPPPSPPTTSASAPASSASPTPSMSVRERDYAAAAEAFKNANRVIDETLMSGKPEMPKELEEFVVPDGPFWQNEADWVSENAAAGERIDRVSTVVAVLPVGDYTPNLVRMYACVDGREVVTISKDGDREAKGGLVAGRLTFRKENGVWRVQGYEIDPDGTVRNFQPVDHCEEDPK